MYIYNVTFLVEQAHKDEFLKWFRDEALTMLVNPESPARSPRMTLVAEVPGDPDFVNHAASYAFQTEYATLDEAKKWATVYLQPIIGKYIQKFGSEHAHSFVTILEEIDL